MTTQAECAALLLILYSCLLSVQAVPTRSCCVCETKEECKTKVVKECKAETVERSMAFVQKFFNFQDDKVRTSTFKCFDVDIELGNSTLTGKGCIYDNMGICPAIKLGDNPLVKVIKGDYYCKISEDNCVRTAQAIRHTNQNIFTLTFYAVAVIVFNLIKINI